MRAPAGGVGRFAGLALVVLVATVFAYLNGDDRMTVDLGFAVFYRLPVVVVVFTAFLLGMVTMFLLGLRHDLKVRRYLREHRAVEDPYGTWTYDQPPDDDEP